MSVRSILNPRVLRGRFTQMPTVGTFALTEEFYQSPSDVQSDEYMLSYDPIENRAAPLGSSDGPAAVIDSGDLDEKRGILIHGFWKQEMPGSVLRALLNDETGAIDDISGREVNRRLAKMKRRAAVTKEVAFSKILGSGKIYVDHMGHIQESSDAAYRTLDFGVDSSHQGNLGGIIGAAWDVSSTDIQAHLDKIDEAAEAANVPIPTDIWVNGTWKNKLRSNAKFLDLITASHRDAEAVLRGNVITDAFGKTWHFYSGTYKDASGTTRKFIPDNKAILVPPKGPWMEATRGSKIVPKSLDIAASAEAALRNMEAVYGEFAYAKVNSADSPSLVVYAGDTFGLNYADPNAVWQPTIGT